jgi:hypothetical protein
MSASEYWGPKELSAKQLALLTTAARHPMLLARTEGSRGAARALLKRGFVIALTRNVVQITDEGEAFLKASPAP